ncbi:MAG TPA: hypothetical protein VNW29_04490 [Candidatus Sulfotelmatobacter sp.]|jgi:mRNA-degrading endonuclease YafQ of YafQ-DinJ toxin-antitoxin module|nr:hypothetical protein [Candidatus Sulfotelmatobacter sp.]
MYILLFTKDFDESYIKLTKGNIETQKRIQKAITFLRQDPFYPSLRTHKANSKNYGEKWSSWVTGDIRIIWDFDSEEQLTILLLTIGRHSGTQKVYQ